MKELFITHSQFVSIAHRYWVDELSSERNLNLFGGSASYDGLGHDLEVNLTFSRRTPEQRQIELVNQVKELWDHSSWIKTPPSECSSLEVLTWDLVSRFGAELENIKVIESPRIWAEWSAKTPDFLAVGWRRDISVLWKEGGGARLPFHFVFQGKFETRKHVLVPRTYFEKEMEAVVFDWEEASLTFSRDVKENDDLMDALFKALFRKQPLLVSMACEIEKQKKWLIHSPIPTR